MEHIKKESLLTISVLQKRLKAKINWVKVFLVLFVGMAMYNYENRVIVYCMAVATILYSLVYFILMKEYRKLGLSSNFEDSALINMKSNLAAIKSAIKKETIWGVVIIPVAIVIATIMRHSFHNNSIANAVEAFTDLRYIGPIIIGSLLAMFLAMKANDYSFGGNIKKLEKQIRELESL